jgi:hypothetical protein
LRCARQNSGKADEGEQFTRQLLEEVELVEEMCTPNVDYAN